MDLVGKLNLIGETGIHLPFQAVSEQIDDIDSEGDVREKETKKGENMFRYISLAEYWL